MSIGTATRVAPNGQTITYRTIGYPNTETVLNLGLGGVPESVALTAAGQASDANGYAITGN